ncbi:tape measure protein [Stenotrophomonas sp. PS02301]|uniref:tape measure protein n=1 Tax=Stenotrophomonas sp. PS02301 TaxID=2991427 RepID=UPI00249B518D|nr:tape measure protein [Stenotrophomonas sp. PS02301]
MNPTVTLRLTADNSQLLPTVRTSSAEVKRLGDTAQATGQQAQRGGAGIASMGAASGTAAGKVGAMTSALTAARTAAVGYLASQSVTALVSMSDQYANISGRLKLATADQKSYAAASAEVFAVSQRTSTLMETTTTLYARLAQSTAEYGVSQQRQLALAETINQTFTVSGASAVAASNTITQLTQALAGGVLRAEEFNSVIENSPRLAQALADGMGVGMGELRKQVNDGQVSVDKLVKALESQSSTIQAEFNQMPLTVERAMVQLRNSVTKYVGEASQELGAGSGLAESIAFLARNMEQIDQIAGVLAVAFGGRLVAGLVAATASKVAAAVASRELARQELAAATAAEHQAQFRVAMARSGVAAAGGLAAAELAFANAQARTAAATQAASISLTAKAAAVRGLNMAMSAFGGPVGLAITALSLFVMWVRNSEQEAKELSKTVTAGFQSSIKTLEGFNEQTANTSFAELSGSLDTIKAAEKEIGKLRDRYEELSNSARSFQARDRALPYGFDKEMTSAADAIKSAEVRLQQLTTRYDDVIGKSTSYILQAAGVTDATDAQRKSVEELVRRQANQGLTMQQNMDLYQPLIQKLFGVDAAARLAGKGFEQAGAAATASAAAIKSALATIDEGLDKQIGALQLQLIEASQGKAARMRAEFIKNAAAQGLDPTSDDYQARRAKNEQVIELTLSLDKQAKATQAVSKAEAEAKRTGDEAKRLRDQQLESQRRYTAEAARAAAEVAGPLAVAETQRTQRVSELDAELKKHNITQAAYNALAAEAERIEQKRKAELRTQQAAPQALLDTLSGEIRLLQVAGTERERYSRQLQNEQDMRRAINEANEAGAGISADMTKRLLAQARAWADVSIQVEQQTANLEEWANVGTRGVADVADLLADTFSNSLDESESFFDRLKDIFKRGWRDIMRTMLEQNLVRPFQEALTNAITGAFSGASTGTSSGNWLSQLGGFFGGNGNSGGSGGQGWMSSLARLIGGGKNMTGTNAMAAGNGWMNSAASAGSMMGFGNNVGGFIGSGSAAGGAGAASTASMAVPIIGWVVAAMMKNAELFDQGWDIKNGESWAGKVATLGAVGHVDDMARKLGLNAKAASILSGSSIHSALFGRKKPQIQGQGIVGSYGFDGLSGQTYADIKAKGGLFRSDKKWTEYGQIDSSVTDAFGSALNSARAGVVGLANQLGVDISTQLKNVRVDLGKVQLDADPEKAQAQLEQLISGAVSNLMGSGIAMLGFNQFLGKGFEASDVMYSLAAAIELTTGNAGDLGRALNSQEVDLVKRTTSMFQSMAKAAGSTMEEQVKAVATAASSYGSVVASAQQEISTDGFSGFAKSLLAVRQEERERIRTLQDQAKALNGLSAREQDLATVRQAARLKADALARSLESELADLALNRINDQIERLGGSADGASSKIADFINSLKLSDTLSPDTDAQKRATASDLMESAAAAGNLDSFATYAQQFLEVSRQLNASGAGYQADYAAVMELAKRLGADGSNASLQQLYEKREALQAQQEAAARLERAQRIAQGVADLGGVRGGDPFELLRSVTGMTAEELASDLGLSTDELTEYLKAQQTNISDLAEILYDLPKRIAQEMVSVMVDGVPTAAGSATVPAVAGATGTPPSQPGVGSGDTAVLDVLLQVNSGISRLVKMNANAELLK